MADENTNPSSVDPPTLRRRLLEPKGVLRKNLKSIVYLGAALLVIVAAIFSSGGKKTSNPATAKNQPPQPALQDNTDNNIADLKSQLQAEQLKEQQQVAATASNPTPATPTAMQPAVTATYGSTGQPFNCVPGQACPQTATGQQNNTSPQLTPAQQQAQQLAAKERALAFQSRFASNLIYARPLSFASQRQAERDSAAPMISGSERNSYASALGQPNSSWIVPQSAGAPRSASMDTTPLQHKPEVNIDSAIGQPYVIYEGTTVDTVLTNRLDGDAVGPVNVLVASPVYSHDRQHVLIPDGTIVLGEARKIGAAGFGQQRRMAVVFHRMIMPDGYSIDLDQFHGLDQIGAEGLKDKVNNHYLQIFGTSIALGVIAGAGEITQGGGTISTSGSQAFATGAAGNVSQSATTVLDRFLAIPLTITIREGHRVKVYFTQDMLLPAYDNHRIPQTF